VIGIRTSVRSGIVPAAATAAVSGTTTLVLSGPAAKSLREDVQVTPVKPAAGNERRIVLPVHAGLAGTRTTILTHRGGISLRRGSEVARLTRLRLTLGKRARLSTRIGGSNVDLFALQGGAGASIDPTAGTVRLGGSRLRLTRAGARAIAAQLTAPTRPGTASKSAAGAAFSVRPGHFGGITARAVGLAITGKAEDGRATEKPAGCSLPNGAGPTPPDPPPLATRPPGAADVTGATLDWHVRESFIRYIATGEGTSASAGATAGPPVLLAGASAPLSYDFRFPFASGWHDAGVNPADPSDNSAAVYFGGALRFLYSGHGIDLTTATPEIEINGASSRAIFTVTEGAEPAKRQVLVNLDLSRAGAITASGGSYTYERVPGAIPAGAASSVFAGFYAPGTEFGCFNLSYTTG